MRKFVQKSQRKPMRRIIVRTETKKTSERKLFLFYHWQKIVWGIAIISIIYALFFHNRNPIQNIAFSQNTYDTYEYKPIMESIAENLKGKPYFRQKYRKRNELISTIRKQFPIVKNIRIDSFDKWTLTLDIVYNTPDITIETLDNQYWYVYRNSFLPYTSGAIIWSWLALIKISLPNDMIQTHSGGVFWKIPSFDIAKIIKKINFLPESKTREFTYYPGREKLKINSDNQIYIISLDIKNIDTTFQKWKDIIPYMPVSDPFTADLSDIDRIVIKQ